MIIVLAQNLNSLVKKSQTVGEGYQLDSSLILLLERLRLEYPLGRVFIAEAK